MHPLISIYIKWQRLYKLVVFHDREDLVQTKDEAWRFLVELRGDSERSHSR